MNSLSLDFVESEIIIHDQCHSSPRRDLGKGMDMRSIRTVPELALLGKMQT